MAYASRDLEMAEAEPLLERVREVGVNPRNLIQIQGPPAANLVQTISAHFQQYDMDDSGTLGLGELIGLLRYAIQPPPTRNGMPLTMQDIAQIMNDYDQSGDEELSLEELMAVFVATGPIQASSEPENMADDGEPFIDGEFPPDESSLGETSAFPASQAQWVRTQDLAPGEMKLFDNIEPNDICQGYLGDCWLLAAMASAAEFSGFIESLFLTKTIPTDDSAGQYRIKLFNGQAWQEIIIDDLIPTFQGRPAFSKPADNELWAMLLEKAVAKMCGDYHATEGGIWNAGWLMFTGCLNQWSFKNPDGFNGNWTKSTMQFNPPTHAGRPLGGSPPEGQFSCDQMWQSLQQWDQQNFMMGAGTFKAGQDSGRTGHSGGEHVRADGIVKGHAYSMLQCIELQADGELWRMVQLRNPWGPSQPGGESTEWNGRFSDGDEAWEENPELSAALDYEEKDDGIFWMTWEDFVDCFDGVYVSGAPVPVPKRSVLKKLGVAVYNGAKNRFDRLNPMSNSHKKLVQNWCKDTCGLECPIC